jgi:integrative and conjugative element protein (TIGR02256 family)
MSDFEYNQLPLQTLPIMHPVIGKASSAVKGIHNSPFCELQSIERVTDVLPNETQRIFNDGDEVIIFDVEVEIAQYTVNDIKRKERIAIVFTAADKCIPWVFALRKGFPEVVHTMMFIKEFPVCLCIYDIPYDELKITWSSPTFVEDIRNWLKKTSTDELHQEGQPLEPLSVFDIGNIILPYDLTSNETLKLHYLGGADKNAKLTFLGLRNEHNHLKGTDCHTFIFKCKPQKHGIISYTPNHISDLSLFVNKAGINLKDEFVQIIKALKSNSDIKSYILLVFILPKKNNDNDVDVHNEIQAYLIIDSIKDIGIKLGLWKEFENELPDLLFSNISQIEFDKIHVGLLKTHNEFNVSLAQKLNKISDNDDEVCFFTIGLGALGSQIFMNMVRAGYGKWILIDDDILLPHNLARHALTTNFIGLPKVSSLSYIANDMLADKTFSMPINTNILNISNPEIQDKVELSLAQSNVVLDFSASISVPRFLFNNKLYKEKRILSAFLNTSGVYQVILFEDEKKNFTIDYLEMIMYRELSQNIDLEDYFSHDATKVRYSNSCRDLSSLISQDHLAIHAASTSNFIKKNIKSKDASVTILKYDSEELILTKLQISIERIYVKQTGEWKVVFDDIFLKKITRLRNGKLPNETGGILVGAWDVEYKTIYILDTLIPEDNFEYPTFFYRGVEGLKEKLEVVFKRTAGAIKYIGEWHSHPEKCAPLASKDDIKLLSWLTYNMSVENLPALMLILSDNAEFQIYIGIENT